MIQRFSSRRQRLDRSFLNARLRGAQGYDRIAGFFCSSLLEVAGEELESVQGSIRIVCNSDLDPADVMTAKAAQGAIRRSWCAFEPERLVEQDGAEPVRDRFRRLYQLLRTGKLVVRVLPDAAFGLIHGKAGVITLADGTKTCFLGSANESKSAWLMNYELLWEDSSAEAVTWIEDEFSALWSSPYAVPLADFVVEDMKRIAERTVIRGVQEWSDSREGELAPDAAPAVIETPVYRMELGLWEHQKHFVKMAFDAHHGPEGKARFVLADQVGLGKTLQLAMSAMLIALTGDRPILVICPRTLIWQWQAEMNDLLAMPSAVWNGKQWVSEQGIEYPAVGPEGIRRCPRRVGIISSGLVTRRSEAADLLLNLSYDCVILDEAHRARRRNLGENRDNESPDANHLLRFMYRIADKTRSLLMATATPVQLRPVEAWDLLDVLSRGHEAVLGNAFSRWKGHPSESLKMVMGRGGLPVEEEEIWEWVRNPMPPRGEHKDFEILHGRLDLPDEESVVRGDSIVRLGLPDRVRLVDLFPRLIQDHNPFIRRIVRRTRHQLETQIDSETGEPFLKPIHVDLLGESDREAIRLPPYLWEAYELAEEFCRELGLRVRGAGFLKTLLLRRMGSSILAGMETARRLLETWEGIEPEEEDVDEGLGDEDFSQAAAELSKGLAPSERRLLERLLAALEANRDRDPKYEAVRSLLMEQGWLEMGCIVFSQYRDSIQWLGELLSEDLPQERIAIYSGASKSGILQGGQWTPKRRDELKKGVMCGRLRLMLGTDAASEGINLQRLASLINLDLPWNPTRLEQRKGRIQRIGQIHDRVKIFNMRYKDSVEDRVHALLSGRLRNIHELFGQIPDVLEDVWVAAAMGEKEQARRIIDAVPLFHPFEFRYSRVEKVDWESCKKVLDRGEKERILSKGW